MTEFSICVFDAYGTLFDVSAAARDLAQSPGQGDFAAHWAAVAADWRAKQLQYSWLRSLTGDYVDFWRITQDALDWALEARGLSDADLRARLLGLYRHLPAYPEVPGVLARLRAGGTACAILSNGSSEMLGAAVESAGLGGAFEAVLSVEEIGVFKPDPRVYDLVGARFGLAASRVLFVSSNGWDVAGAAGYGFRTLWVNRAGDPPDRLPGRPMAVLSDLQPVPRIASGGAP